MRTPRLRFTERLRREIRRIVAPPTRGLERRTDVDIDLPFVLISQMSRSGGTLLSQLFDHHPQCYAHPGELHVGKPKWIWPDLANVNRPYGWWKSLNETKLRRHMKYGYRKSGRHNAERFPFIFDTSIQRRTFLSKVHRLKTPEPRKIFDAYWTSFFVAWYDYQNMYRGDKKYVTGFASQLSMHRKSVERYMSCYPDGYLVSVIRDPWSWLGSALRHTAELRDPRVAIEKWAQSARSICDNTDRYGRQVVVIDFQCLVNDTHRVMSDLAAKIGIDWTADLSVPTFNGMPIVANSSFPGVKSYGIIDSSQRRADANQASVISDQHEQLYALTRSLALTPPRKVAG